VDPADNSSPARTFSLILRMEDGNLQRRLYSFDGVRVHLTGQELYDPANPIQGPVTQTDGSKGSRPAASKAKNWLGRKLSDFGKRLGGSS
jgi:hypothetical protein